MGLRIGAFLFIFVFGSAAVYEDLFISYFLGLWQFRCLCLDFIINDWLINNVIRMLYIVDYYWNKKEGTFTISHTT